MHIWENYRITVLNEGEILPYAGWFKLVLENTRISSMEPHSNTELLAYLQGLPRLLEHSLGLCWYRSMLALGKQPIKEREFELDG